MNTVTTQSACCCRQTPPPVQEEPVLETPQNPNVVHRTARSLPSLLLSVLVAFFPKCPICWAAYMSMFGSIGLAKLPYAAWLFPVLLVFLGLHLFLLLKKAPKKGYGPFVLSLAGVVCILLERSWLSGTEALLYAGMGFILSGSLWNSFSFKLINRRPLAGAEA